MTGSIHSGGSSQLGSDASSSVLSLESRATLRRVGTKVGETLRRVATDTRDAKDENEETERHYEEARQTALGQILTHTGYEDAMDVAQGKGPLAPLEAELADARPTDERLLRKLTRVDTELLIEEEEHYPPPDTGYAWVICFAEVLLTLTTWGATTSFGIFISYWLNNDTFPGADPMNYALSSSLTIFIGQGMAPIATLTSAMIGIRPTMSIGLVLHLLGFILGSYATQLWHIYCTQGLLIGFGFTMMFNPAIVLLPSWFRKYRSSASGITVSGSGIGGVIFALACQTLINEKDDYRWAFRMVGIIAAGLNVMIVILIKERVPRKREMSWKAFKAQCRITLDIKRMKPWYVLSITFWFAFGIVAYQVTVFSLAAFATFIGLSATEGAHVTAIFNAGQAIGRPLIGIAGDKYGRVNLAIGMNIFVIILIFAFFINCSNFITLLFFSIVSGLTTGWCQLLNQAIMPDSVTMAAFPSAWNYENLIVGSFILFAEVVALKLRDLSKPKPFLRAQLFAGFMVVASTFFIVPIRELKIRQMLEARLEALQEDEEEKRERGPERSERILRYKILLQKDTATYFRRLFYPVKV